jgi:hypothetical protein
MMRRRKDPVAARVWGRGTRAGLGEGGQEKERWSHPCPSLSMARRRPFHHQRRRKSPVPGGEVAVATHRLLHPLHSGGEGNGTWKDGFAPHRRAEPPPSHRAKRTARTIWAVPRMPSDGQDRLIRKTDDADPATSSERTVRIDMAWDAGVPRGYILKDVRAICWMKCICAGAMRRSLRLVLLFVGFECLYLPFFYDELVSSTEGCD